MKQQEVFKKIGGIIKELNDQYEYLKAVDGPLNELELELFLANSHFLGDHVAILTRLNAQNLAKKIAEAPAKPVTQNFFEPLVQTPAATETNKSPEKLFELAPDDSPAPHIDLGSSGDSYSYMHEDEPETIRHELILDEADWDEEETYEKDSPTNAEVLAARPAEPEQEPAPIEAILPAFIEPQPVKESIPAVEKPEPVEYFATKAPEPEPGSESREQYVTPVIPPAAAQPAKDDVLTINQRMSAQMSDKSSAAGQLHNQSISDLKVAITLNDKLLFVKELFNGYSLAYSEAIGILNHFNSLEEADTFLKKNYVAKNAWGEKPATVDKFYSLLKRRYA